MRTGERSEESAYWLHEGVVVPRHLLARACSLLPGRAQLLWRLPSDARTIALTFDDGPDPKATPGIAELLHKRQASASFFVLTENLRTHAAIVRDALAAGHEIGLHGHTHERLVGLPVGQCAQLLLDARRRLEDAVEMHVRLYRPPYGQVSLSVLRAASQAQLQVVLWSHDPRDWSVTTRVPLASRLDRCTEAGAIVLLHDRIHVAARGEPSALAGALTLAASRGLRVRSLATASV